MKKNWNWKTTTGAILVGLSAAFQSVGWVDTTLATTIQTVGVFIIGLFAGDSANITKR